MELYVSSAAMRHPPATHRLALVGILVLVSACMAPNERATPLAPDAATTLAAAATPKGSTETTTPPTSTTTSVAPVATSSSTTRATTTTQATTSTIRTTTTTSAAMGEWLAQLQADGVVEEPLVDRLLARIRELRPTPPRRWQANQYGCHSDGRCLDDYDARCDEAEWVELEGASGGSVCYETYSWLADDLAAEMEDE